MLATCLNAKGTRNMLWLQLSPAAQQGHPTLNISVQTFRNGCWTLVVKHLNMDLGVGLEAFVNESCGLCLRLVAKLWFILSTTPALITTLPAV